MSIHSLPAKKTNGILQTKMMRKSARTETERTPLSYFKFSKMLGSTLRPNERKEMSEKKV